MYAQFFRELNKLLRLNKVKIILFLPAQCPFLNFLSRFNINVLLDFSNSNSTGSCCIAAKITDKSLTDGKFAIIIKGQRLVAIQSMLGYS